MSVPGWSKGRDVEGNFGEINPGIDGYDGPRKRQLPAPAFDPDYDRDDRDKDRSSSATNKIRKD